MKIMPAATAMADNETPTVNPKLGGFSKSSTNVAVLERLPFVS